MKWIVSADDFFFLENLLSSAVEKNKVFPGKVVKPIYDWFLFMSFDSIFTKAFFDCSRAHLAICCENEIFISIIDPDPVRYFFANFQHYATMCFSVNDSSESYISEINKDPGGSPADAIIHNSNIVVVAPIAANWIIFGERRREIAVCAFLSKSDREIFRSSYEKILLDGAEVAALIAYGNSNSKEKDEFINNYNSVQN